MLRNGQRPGKLQEREPPEGERQEARLAAAEQRLRQRILEEQGDAGLLTDQALRRRIDEEILREAERFSLSERTRLHRNLFNSFRRFGILQELLEDPSVNEIMVNGPESVFLERDGGVVTVDPEEVAVGEVFVLKAGDRVVGIAPAPDDAWIVLVTSDALIACAPSVSSTGRLSPVTAA